MTAKKKKSQVQLNITVDELKHGTAFDLKDFTISNRGLYYKQVDKKTGEETVFKMCEPLFVKQIVQNIDTNDVHLDFCYKFRNRYQTLQIGMGQLIPNELIKLMAKGADIPHEFLKPVATYLREQQKSAPAHTLFNNVGWHRNEINHLVFRLNTIISNDSSSNSQHDNARGSYNLEPKGNLEVWTNMVTNEVVGQTPLEVALAIGFSSVIVGYLSQNYDGVDTLVSHFAGNSTQGKTTAALLAVSAFGIPAQKKGGLCKSWNGTTNSLLNMLGGNFGIPLVLDELSMSNDMSLTSTLYVLSSGQEKSRLTDTIQQQKQGTWATSLISTGELSIFQRTNKNVGLTIRALEFSNVTWTKSAENADAIRNAIQDNFGHAGEAFVRFLFAEGLTIVDETWKSWQNKCHDALQDSPFRSRVAKKYAVILTAAELANRALGIDLSLDKILLFLVQHDEQIGEQRDIGKKAWDIMIQLIIKHQSNFKNGTLSSNPFQCWGKFIPNDVYVEVAILKHVLEDLLKQNGFEDSKVVLKSWREKNLINAESGRNTRRTKLFDDEEQEVRQKVLGKKPPQKPEDTTYNLKIPTSAFGDLFRTVA